MGKTGDDLAGTYIQCGIGIALVAPGAFSKFGHPAAEFFAGKAEPGVKVYHPVQFVEVKACKVYVISVYHWATVALKMSSIIFSMISAQRLLSTASSELVES